MYDNIDEKLKNKPNKPNYRRILLLITLFATVLVFAISTGTLRLWNNTSEFTNDLPQYRANDINIHPKNVWYEGGKLYAEMFITNGFSPQQMIVGYDFNNFPIYHFVNVNIYNIRVNRIAISNSNGLIAEASFGLLDGAAIPQGSYITWTFYFDENDVYKTNADLTNLSWECQLEYDR